MKEDEYIDLDKVSAVPSEGDAPGFSKKEGYVNKDGEQKVSKKQNKKTAKKAVKKSTKKSVKKKATTKQSPNKVKKKRKKSSNSGKKVIYFLLGLVILAILVIAVIRIISTELEPEEERVLMLINGVPLMSSEVQTMSDWLRLVTGLSVSEEQVLDLSVDLELLSQEARRLNFSVSDEEVEDFLVDMATSGGLSYEELKEFVESLDIDFDLLKKAVKKELYANLISGDIAANVEVSEEDLLQYYEENKEQFFHDELAIVRHIQIDFEENVSENETLQEAKRVKQKIDENLSNFCELVVEYSGDFNTKTLEICGEYVIEKQEFEDEFSKKSFELEEDELAIVKSEVGYHILLKVESVPQGISSFEDVKEIIEYRLEVMKIEQTYYDLIAELREKADIEDYSGLFHQEELLDVEDLIDELDLNISDEVLIDQEIVDDLEDIVEEVEEEVEEIVDDLEDVVDEVEDVEEEVEEEIELEEEQEEELSIIESNKVLRLAKCLTEKGAKMYGVYWSPHTEQQAEAFGEYFEYIVNIECDPDGANPQVEECESVLQKQFPTWPTWLIDGELYEGYLNLHRLSSISGCPY